MDPYDGSPDSTDGLVIVAAKIRNPEVRERFWHHMLELSGERLMANIYQFQIDDWDEGLWQEEVQWMTDLMDESSGSIIVWKFQKDRYVRLSIGSDV